MKNNELFIERITSSYRPKGAFINLGSGILGKEIIALAQVNLALKRMNRHDLIASATDTGKTRTPQLIAEQLSDETVTILC